MTASGAVGDPPPPGASIKPVVYTSGTTTTWPPPVTSGGPMRVASGGPLVEPRSAEPEPEPAPVELVVLPTKLPRKVLVAFIAGDGEDDREPFWAAYLEPEDLDLFLSPDAPEDATMDLRLKLVKRWEK